MKIYRELAFNYSHFVRLISNVVFETNDLLISVGVISLFTKVAILDYITIIQVLYIKITNSQFT